MPVVIPKGWIASSPASHSGRGKSWKGWGLALHVARNGHSKCEWLISMDEYYHYPQDDESIVTEMVIPV